MLSISENEIDDSNKKYAVISTIRSPGNRFFGLWSPQRPFRKTHSFRIEKMLFEDKYFFEDFWFTTFLKIPSASKIRSRNLGL